MEKATIYDYARMCKGNKNNCAQCPLNSCMNGTYLFCQEFVASTPDKANEIILKWCEKCPAETRQDRFLNMFPNADISCGFLDIGPCAVDERLANEENCPTKSCLKCKKTIGLRR